MLISLVHAEMIQTNRFDKNSDLSTTYLGKTRMSSENTVKAEKKFPISGQGYTLGIMLDDDDCQILLDTGAGKSYMSKPFYLRCKSLHITKICLQYTKHTGRKWSICWFTICDTSNCRHTWSQV